MNREPDRNVPGDPPSEGDNVKHASDGTPPAKLKLLLFWVLFVVLVAGVVFVGLEGMSSSLLVGRQLFTEPEYVHLPERLHTTYDPDLGWVNLPNLKLDDIYGPGKHLHTNSLGFRNKEEFEVEVAGGTGRIVCSGDSYTLGHGVDDDLTWCQLLGELGNAQVINMGQAAYGIDQAYLWYLRDGRRFEHQIQVLAFITDDFYRMQRPHFAGHPKPTLDLADGRLVVRNVPVPRPGGLVSWWQRARPRLMELRSAQLVNHVAQRFFPGRTVDHIDLEPADLQALELTFALVQDLARINAEKGSTLVLAYLPADYDYTGTDSDRWRQPLAHFASQHGIPFLDLVPELRQLPAETLGRLYFPFDSPGTGHLSEAGNAWVAEKLREFLRGLPQFAGAGWISKGGDRDEPDSPVSGDDERGPAVQEPGPAGGDESVTAGGVSS